MNTQAVSRSGNRLSWLVGGAFLLAIASMQTVVPRATGRLISSLGADPLALQLLNGLVLLPPLIVVLTVAAVVLLAPVWRSRYWRLPERIYYTALAASAVVFTWLLAFWQLLGSA